MDGISLCELRIDIEPADAKMPDLQYDRALTAIEAGLPEAIAALVQGWLVKAGCNGWDVKVGYPT